MNRLPGLYLSEISRDFFHPPAAEDTASPKWHWYGFCNPDEKTTLRGLTLRFGHKSKGFTLIEILIALVILSISLLALAGLMVTTTRNNASGGHVTEAATFAQDRLEELRATRWDDIVTGQDQRLGSTGITYRRNWNVVVTGNIRTVTITVNWTDRSNHSISLLSVITE